jgi:diguanylate cyclase (GGDEF)-like protein
VFDFVREAWLDAIAGENLKDLFKEKWQDLFTTLSDALGFSLSIHDDAGRPLLIHATSPFCELFRSASPERKTQCEASCRTAVLDSVREGKPRIFKCSARIMSFSLPIEYLGQKAVILGQGSFAGYDDFRAYMNIADIPESDPVPLRAPLAFTTAEDTRRAQVFVTESVNRLLMNSQETVTLRRKFESLKSVLSWSEAAGHQPDTLYRDMLDSLATLLDIRRMAVLIPDRQRRYTAAYSIGGNGREGDVSMAEHDRVVRELLNGSPCVEISEARTGSQADFLSQPRVLTFFPVIIDKQLEAVLRIEGRIAHRGDIDIISGFCRHAALAIENHRLRGDLYKKFNALAAIAELTRATIPIQNEKTLLQVILDKSAELLKAEQGSLMVLDHDTDALLLQAKKGLVKGVTEKLRIGRGEGIAGKVVELGEPFLVENVESDPRTRQKNRKHYKTTSFLSVPIKIEERIIGVLNLSDKDGGEAFNEEDLKLIQSVASQVAVIMERNLFYNKTEELKKLTITDELTGLLNRRYLYERLKDELARSERHGNRLSILMLDLDGFKECNDTYGHLAGDKALKQIAESLLNTVRSMDIVARYGGDEFMVILPETGEAIAIEIAERLRRSVARSPVLSGNETTGRPCLITTSIGIACYPEHGKTVELLLKHADKALYRAKNKGKNSLEVFA